MSKVFTTDSGPLNQRSLPAGRWGRLRFSEPIVAELIAGQRWGDLAAFGPRFFVVDTRATWGELEVLAVSPDFDEIDEGEAAPLYDLWMEKTDEGVVRFLRFERQS